MEFLEGTVRDHMRMQWKLAEADIFLRKYKSSV